MSKHEQTIEEHVNGNLMMALDQMHCHESVEECMMSYGQNTEDSCIEDGYSRDEAFDAQIWFITKFEKAVQ